MAEQVRLRQEDYIFGIIAYPRRPIIHQFFLLAFGALMLIIDIYKQLPADMADLEKTDLDPNTWYAFPFIFMAVIIAEKKIFRNLCDQFRLLAIEEDQVMTVDDLNQMANNGMRRLWRLRLMSTITVVLGWFIIFNVMLLSLIHFTQ